MPSNPLTKLSRHLLRQALDALPGAAMVVDAHGPERLIVFANPAAATLCGRPVTDLIGLSLNTLLVDAPEPGSVDPWLLRPATGAPLLLATAPLYASPGVPSCWLVTPAAGATDVSRERGAARPAAADRAPPAQRLFDPMATGAFSVTDSWMRMRDERNDPITGVLSGDAFLEVLERDVSLARRGDRAISIMLFRVEAVETYQSLFGRHATDACLRKVAHSISTNLRRGSDCCGRTGHAEFAVVSHGGDPASTAEFAARIAARVRDLAIHHPRTGNGGRYVTVSWGLVVSGSSAWTSDGDVLAAARADLDFRAAVASVDASRSGGTASA